MHHNGAKIFDIVMENAMLIFSYLKQIYYNLMFSLPTPAHPFRHVPVHD